MSLRNDRKYYPSSSSTKVAGVRFHQNKQQLQQQQQDDDEEPLISSKETFDHLTFEIDSLINTVCLLLMMKWKFFFKFFLSSFSETYKIATKCKQSNGSMYTTIAQ